MTESDFVDKVLDVPWVNRGTSFDGMDCYGVVILYYRHVLGIELPNPAGYVEGVKTDQCWASETSSGRWQQVDRPSSGGIVLTAYYGDTPVHVGMVISGRRVLHCRGSESERGKVEIHNIAAIERAYGRVTYHEFRGLNG